MQSICAVHISVCLHMCTRIVLSILFYVCSPCTNIDTSLRMLSRITSREVCLIPCISVEDTVLHHLTSLIYVSKHVSIYITPEKSLAVLHVRYVIRVYIQETYKHMHWRSLHDSESFWREVSHSLRQFESLLCPIFFAHSYSACALEENRNPLSLLFMLSSSLSFPLTVSSLVLPSLKRRKFLVVIIYLVVSCLWKRPPLARTC